MSEPQKPTASENLLAQRILEDLEIAQLISRRQAARMHDVVARTLAAFRDPTPVDDECACTKTVDMSGAMKGRVYNPECPTHGICDQ